MNEFLWLFFGALLAGGADWLLIFWRRSEERQRRSDAAEVLKRHGLTPQLYLATINEEALRQIEWVGGRMPWSSRTLNKELDDDS